MNLSPFARLRRVALLMILLLAVGTAGYVNLCDLSLIDGLYMTVITMSTVGFREVGTLTDAAKLFTIGLIFSGAGVLAYAVSTSLELVVDDQHRLYFTHLLNRRRSRRMEHHYIVCGMGRVGQAVCRELADSATPFIVIDNSTEKIQQASRLGYVAIMGDASEDKVLQEANITKARGLVCTVDTDAANLFLLVSAKALNPQLEVSARVNDDVNVKKFERAGATHVYSPFSLLGRRIARSITRPHVQELLDVALEENNFDITIDEFTVSTASPLAWLSLKDSGIRQNFGGVVMSIIRENREILHNPDPELICQPGDILITLGTPEQLKKLREIVELK